MGREEELLRRLRAAFEIEAQESLSALDAGLLELERAAPGPLPAGPVERIFREAHNLKGAARAVNYPDIETICQPLESVFATWKKGAPPPPPSGFDVLHSALDIIKSCVATGHPGGDVSAVSAALAAMAKGSVPAAPPPDLSLQVTPPVTSTEPPVAVPVVAPTFSVAPSESDTVRIETAKLDAMLRKAEELLAAKLAARELATQLRDFQTDFTLWEQDFALLLPALRALVMAQGAEGLRLAESLEWSRKHLQTLRGAARAMAAAAAADGSALGAMVDALLDDTKQLLLLPCAPLLDGFARPMRDLARQRGKEVDFFTSGGDVEVDKRILEALKAPLLHLLRNAIDHGLEEREARLASGKPERARVALRVARRGGEVEFAVSDDGAGLNVAKIKRKAQQLGLFTVDEAEKLDAAEAMQLIFTSEFSTSEQVDEVSGRGLGMAIVRENVERHGGRIAIESAAGQGTTFLLTLPQTLATFRGLLVAAGGQTYVLPAADVVRVNCRMRTEVHRVGNRETLHLDGRTVRLLSLSAALGYAAAPNLSEKLTVVVIGHGDRAAFEVDEVLDEQEVLVKPLAWPLEKVRCVSGVTLLGSGQPAAILDSADLLAVARSGESPVATRSDPAARKVRAQLRVLVVDDSLTSRMLLKDVFEGAGYFVKTATDGLEALTALRSEAFDILISDVEMPRMDGFQLVERLRTDNQFQDLPTVLVTSLDSREDRERGFDVGANAYVVKSNFDQGNLLEIVRRLV